MRAADALRPPKTRRRPRASQVCRRGEALNEKFERERGNLGRTARAGLSAAWARRPVRPRRNSCHSNRSTTRRRLFRENPARATPENLDEPKKLIEQESTDVQAETPDVGNPSVEQIEEEAKPSQGFEDDDADGG